jgi:hypothetical protein
LDLVLGSSTAANKVKDQSDKRANQQEMNHRGSHMKNEKPSKPENKENREQDNKYW